MKASWKPLSCPFMAAAVRGRDSEDTVRRRGRELRSTQTKVCCRSGRDGDSERTKRPAERARIYRAAPARARLGPRPSASRANAPPAGGGGLAVWCAQPGEDETILTKRGVERS